MAYAEMAIQIESFGETNTGLVRQRNEDAWRRFRHLNVFALADGMGGHRAGDVAAMEAVARLGRHLNERLDAEISEMISPEQAMDVVADVILRVNEEVHALGRSSPELHGMGTTLCVLYVHQDQAILGHVGDSRIYRMRKGRLTQLTQDHSLMREMLDEGSLNPKDVQSFKKKHVITRAIGVDPFVEPSVDLVSLEDGDLFLLCSDGLTDLKSNREIESIMQDADCLEVLSRKLIDAANDAGGVDNTTVVLVRVNVEESA